MKDPSEKVDSVNFPKTLARVVTYGWILLPLTALFSLLAYFVLGFPFPTQPRPTWYLRIPIAFTGWVIWLVLNTIFLLLSKRKLSSKMQKSSLATLGAFLIFVLFIHNPEPPQPEIKAPPSHIRPI
ncbi:hypothetical protein [Legionella massiliensis]|nr:hypothetical protein [Legionella massiliensis]